MYTEKRKGKTDVYNIYISIKDVLRRGCNSINRCILKAYNSAMGMYRIPNNTSLSCRKD